MTTSCLFLYIKVQFVVKEAGGNMSLGIVMPVNAALPRLPAVILDIS